MTHNITFQLIKLAVSGNTMAINRIVDIYSPYITTLASRTLYDSDGNEYVGVNVDLQQQLIRKLIQLIITFKIT